MTLNQHLEKLNRRKPIQTDEELDKFGLVPINARTAIHRAAIAVYLMMAGYNGSRACDNCFEMNDGDEVVCALISHAKKDEAFRRVLAAQYSPQCLTDGYPSSWLELWNKTQNPLGI